MPIHYSAQSSSSLATNKMFGFHVKLLLVAVIASFAVDAVHIDCNFLVYPMPLNDRLYACVAKVILSGSTTLENVTGVHASGQTNDNVEFLYIIENNLSFVPKRIENIFKNLKALYFWKTTIPSISAEDLKPFPQLELFELGYSNVTSIPGDLFSFTPRLKFIKLASNGIKHIGQDLVTNLTNLQSLYLQGNICIDRYVNSRAEVVQLAPQLSVLCPPLDLTTTVATTTTPTTTTTKLPIEKCLCHDEIEGLHKENQLQSKEIQEQNKKIQEQSKKIQEQDSNIDQLIQVNDKQFKQNSAVEKRLLEVEMKLREMPSNSN